MYYKIKPVQILSKNKKKKKNVTKSDMKNAN